MEHKFRFAIESWSAWSPGLIDLGQAEQFAAHIRSDKQTALAHLTGTSKPHVARIAPTLRRRCSDLARAALSVGLGSGDSLDITDIPTVFASQFGESTTTTKLLKEISTEESLSPMSFGLSVHNSASGMFSLSAKNTKPSVAIAAGRETFLFGFWESISRLEESFTASERDSRLLYVMADETVPYPLCESTSDPLALYALGFLLRRSSGEIKTPYSLTLSIASSVNSQYAWRIKDEDTKIFPAGLWFISWLLSSDSCLAFETQQSQWIFEKDNPDISWGLRFVATNEQQAA